MQAKDLMEQKVISVLVDATVEEIGTLMIEHNISGVPVVNDVGTILGVVSEMDILRKEPKPELPGVWKMFVGGRKDKGEKEDYQEHLQQYLATTADKIMTSPAITVDELDDIEKVGRLMFDRQIKRVFVTKNGCLMGIISRSAFVKLLVQEDYTSLS